MRVFIYGNSLIRSVKLHDVADIVCVKGAKLQELVRLALERPEVTNCLLCVIEGPIRYSKLVRNKHQREMVQLPSVPNIFI